MQKILADIKGDHLRIYIAWVPILRGDNSESAAQRSDEFYDKRLSYFWDGGKLTMSRWRQIMQLRAAPWDSYFLYGSKANWRIGVTPPEIWQHKLGVFRTVAPRFTRESMENLILERLPDTE